LAVIVAGALGGGVFDRLSGGGFSDPDAESARGTEQLEEVFGTGDPNLILLVTAKQGLVDDPKIAVKGVAITEDLAREPSIEQAFSYWTLGSALPLRNNNGSQALVLARIDGDEDQVDAAIEELSPKYTREDNDISINVGGQAEVFSQVTSQVESDLRQA
jgi:RND superfamily putative drug exporter